MMRFAVLLLLSHSQDVVGSGPRDIPGRPVRAREVNRLPNLEEPWIRYKFKCSACLRSVEEMIAALQAARAASSTPLSVYDTNDTMESVCMKQMPLLYGVAATVGSGRAGDYEFTKGEHRSLVKGGPFGRILEHTCYAIYRRAGPRIESLSNLVVPQPDMIRKICESADECSPLAEHTDL